MTSFSEQLFISVLEGSSKELKRGSLCPDMSPEIELLVRFIFVNNFTAFVLGFVSDEVEELILHLF